MECKKWLQPFSEKKIKKEIQHEKEDIRIEINREYGVKKRDEKWKKQEKSKEFSVQIS